MNAGQHKCLVQMKAEHNKRITQKTAGLHKRLASNESRTTQMSSPSER
jgi:hypothetical protein